MSAYSLKRTYPPITDAAKLVLMHHDWEAVPWPARDPKHMLAVEEREPPDSDGLYSIVDEGGSEPYRCPWDTAAMLHRISNNELASRAVENFIREIARQAVISQSSMMGREIGRKGFRAAPVLSQVVILSLKDFCAPCHRPKQSGLLLSAGSGSEQQPIFLI